jgi:hypothetical protein
MIPSHRRSRKIDAFITMAGMMIAAVTAVTSVGCRAPRQDQTAFNTEDTGQYEIVAQTQPEPRVYEVRVRVQNLDRSTQIARDLVHQKAALSPLKVRIHVLGPGDAADAAPRKTFRWPEELDYRLQ